MAKRLSIKTVTVGDIKRRHPRYLTCETDRQYAQLANDIYELMHGELGFMEERVPHREFTKQEFVDAGLAGAVKIPNADQEAFEAFLRQIGHENDIQGICFDLWFFAAHEGDLQLGDKSYKTYFEDVVLAESQDRLAEQGLSHQEAMQRMEQYMDHMPRWMLRGHSPSEMQKT